MTQLARIAVSKVPTLSNAAWIGDSRICTAEEIFVHQAVTHPFKTLSCRA